MEKGSRVPYGKMWFSNEDLGAIFPFNEDIFCEFLISAIRSDLTVRC